MKATTLLTLILLLGFNTFAQDEDPAMGHEEDISEKVEEKKVSTAETKSFTLDANNAVLEEKVISEEPE